MDSGCPYVPAEVYASGVDEFGGNAEGVEGYAAPGSQIWGPARGPCGHRVRGRGEVVEGSGDADVGGSAVGAGASVIVRPIFRVVRWPNVGNFSGMDGRQT